jgi:ABC-type Zn uptake system ZnuABC Zn-binding protein ZnuA
MRNLFALLMVLCISPATGRAEKLKVSSFSTILTEIAQQVGGDRVQVTGHVKSGVDPHDFEPKPSDLKTVSSADLILLSAKHVEGYVGKLREASGARAAILEVGNRLPSLTLREEPGGGKREAEDPHWWNSVGNIIRATRIVQDELIRLRPGDKAVFTANAAPYLDKLTALQDWVKRKVAELPRDRRKLVTNHDAFGYFAKEFGFTVYPIAGVSKNDQPGSKKVAGIVAAIRAQGVKAIFSESSENPKVIQQITRETGVRIGGELLADGLGTGEQGTIDGMFRHNVTTIVEALK